VRVKAGRRAVMGFSEILNHAARIGKARLPRVAVAGAHDKLVLEVVADAAARGFASPLLFGDGPAIAGLVAKHRLALKGCEVVDVPDGVDAARAAVEAASSGEADVLMKGNVTTATLMKAALDPEIGIKADGLMTHVAIIEAEGYPRLLFMSDGGIVIEPSLEEKVAILKNAVAVAKALGVRVPRVALVSSIEIVNLKMRSSVDAAIISKMAARGQIKGAIVDGPLAMDNAISPEAAKHKGIVSPVAGRADVIIVGHADVGNVMYKALTNLCGAHVKTAGVIVGGKVPMVVVSRSDPYSARLNSMAIGCVLAIHA
jgi:phosphate butyryltransferase